MTCGIYSITNKNTGKMYIGQSINIENRFKQHCYGHNKHSWIDKDIRRIGKENFCFKIIHECSEENLDDEERKFINLYCTFQQGYNLTSGGNGGRLSHNTKIKISKAHNTTGYLNVLKVNLETSFQGFTWVYKYSDKNGDIHKISRVNLNELETIILEKGWPWEIIDEKKALNSQIENEVYLSDFKKTTNTGFLGVSKISHKRVKQGFIYQYNTPYNPNGVNSSFGSVSFEKLRRKVLARGLPWGLIDEDKAKASGLV